MVVNSTQPLARRNRAVSMMQSAWSGTMARALMEYPSCEMEMVAPTRGIACIGAEGTEPPALRQMEEGIAVVASVNLGMDDTIDPVVLDALAVDFSTTNDEDLLARISSLASKSQLDGLAQMRDEMRLAVLFDDRATSRKRSRLTMMKLRFESSRGRRGSDSQVLRPMMSVFDTLGSGTSSVAALK